MFARLSVNKLAAQARFGAASARARPARMMTFKAVARQVVHTDKAPPAVGPYSQAIKHGSTVYVSGQIPLVPGTKDFAGDDIKVQTKQVMENLGAILEEAGSGFPKVIKTTILLADIADFAAVNEVYATYFPSEPPARATFAVKDLPLGAKVEIDCIAALD
ncbi:unnamed protein product [Pedinophyceae sp. YPF-701]|nr:unnamed protein product [Pedinophyceae sp. YPF-701]